MRNLDTNLVCEIGQYQTAQLQKASHREVTMSFQSYSPKKLQESSHTASYNYLSQLFKVTPQKTQEA